MEREVWQILETLSKAHKKKLRDFLLTGRDYSADAISDMLLLQVLKPEECWWLNHDEMVG